MIFFAEDPAEVAPIAVSTDLAGASLASTQGQASVSLGTLSGASNLLLDVAAVQPGTQEQTGGGKGVADMLQLLSFVSAGQVVGFEALYLSDKGGPGLPNPGFPTHPTFCSTMPVNEPACAPGQPNSVFVKTGALMSFFENVTLPGTSGSTALEVEIRSPCNRCPSPRPWCCSHRGCWRSWP